MSVPTDAADQTSHLDSTGWRLRYHESLEALERKEAEWAQLEVALYRNLGQLALVLYGEDPELDGELEGLRVLLRERAAPPRIERAIAGLHAVRDRRERAGATRHPSPSPAAVPADATRAQASVLRELLGQLNLPPPLDEEAATLGERLAGSLEATDLPSFVTGIAHIVGSMRRELHAQRLEVERFLTGINDRLAELETFLNDEDSERAASTARGEQLRSSVEDGMAAARSELDRARDLEGLKALVSTRLATFSEHVERHLRSEAERNEALERSVGRLRRRLDATRQQADGLRDRLEAARTAAEHDPLTGLLNRAAFESLAAREHARWKRHRKPLSLALWDLDHFKQINDRYGHQAGDRVLKAVAELLRAQVRRTDSVARYGGEELVMLMPDTDRSAALAVTEQLRDALESARFRYRVRSVRVTASCGVTELREGDSVASALKRADEALYRAKADGRNCTRAA